MIGDAFDSPNAFSISSRVIELWRFAIVWASCDSGRYQLRPVTLHSTQRT